MAKKQPITTGAVGGRPPMEDPLQRISIPVRGLVSVPVRQALDQALEMHGCTTSDLLRLALFNLLKKGLAQVWVTGGIANPRVHFVTGAGFVQVPIDARPKPTDRPLPGDRGAHGDFDSRAHASSAYFWMSAHSKGLAVAGLAALTAAGVYASRRFGTALIESEL